MFIELWWTIVKVVFGVKATQFVQGVYCWGRRSFCFMSHDPLNDRVDIVNGSLAHDQQKGWEHSEEFRGQLKSLEVKEVILHKHDISDRKSCQTLYLTCGWHLMSIRTLQFLVEVKGNLWSFEVSVSNLIQLVSKFNTVSWTECLG